jgi:hypothetical protein
MSTDGGRYKIIADITYLSGHANQGKSPDKENIVFTLFSVGSVFLTMSTIMLYSGIAFFIGLIVAISLGQKTASLVQSNKGDEKEDRVCVDP